MDLFATSSIITFFTSIGFGLFVYSKDTSSKLGKAWLGSSLTIAMWALSLYGVTSSQDMEIALYWQYVLDFFAILIPVFYFIFISVFLNLNNNKVRYIFILIGVALSFFSLTTLFKIGVSIKFGFYWVDPGKFYIVSPIFFVGLTVYTIFLLFKVYFKNKKDKISQEKIKYHILASIVGFGGGATNFFPQLFDVFPYGNYFVILYVFFMSYSVLMHQSFSTVRAIAAELLAAALAIVFLFNFLISAPILNELIFKFTVFVFVVFFGLVLVRGIYKEVEIKEKVSGLVHDIATANERLRQLEKQKSEFVSIASHQLRTPLTAIKGYTSMLLEGSFGKISKEAKEAVQKIFNSSQRLVALVEDLLTVSRIEQGRIKYEFSNFNVREIVDEVIKDKKLAVDEKGLRFFFKAEDGDVSYMVRGDITKMKQVVNNIVDNAIKYTSKGLIRVLLSKDEATNKVRISVSDTGMGMDKETIEHIFKMFNKQGGSSKETLPVSGIGLYVARQIMKAHRGRIWAGSGGVGQGTTFFIEMNGATGIEEVNKDNIQQFKAI